MIARVAAVLAVGLSSLFATAAPAGAQIHGGPDAVSSVYAGPPPPPPPPEFTAPPPPGTFAAPPVAEPEDSRPWPPAYAPSRYGPSLYEAGSAHHERLGGEERRYEHREFRHERHEGAFGREHACGLCAPHASVTLPPPPPPCLIACEAVEEVAPPISDAFFIGGMSGGTGPGLEIGGPVGGGGFAYASGFGFAHSFAYASATATASASAKAHGCPVCFRPKPPVHHGCNCGHKGK